MSIAALRGECANLRARLAECEAALAEAEAREALAGEGFLTIAQIALLAGMVERSVRNSASAREFHTVSERGRTLVPAKEARRWLAGRRKAIV